MKLFFQSYPKGTNPGAGSKAPIIIIPGLFGSTNNWRGFARSVGEYYPVLVIDVRNHGRSEHANTHSYRDLAQDLLEFIDQQGIERIIPCGHSMGGKVAMVFSLLYPQRVASLVVLDIAPVGYSHNHAPFLDELIKLDLASLTSRGEADRTLQQAVPDTSTRLFLLQSLTGSPGHYRWRLNLHVLRRFMPEIVDFPTVDLINRSSEVATTFIYGEDSDYLQDTHYPKCQEYFPNAEFKGVAKAGHWLHIDNPPAVLEALLDVIQIGEKNE